MITSGTARNAAIGRPAAGKTGTTQGFAAAWFVGFIPQLTTAVWVGDPRGGFAHPLIGVPGGTGRRAYVYGGGLPARVWSALMTGALQGAKVEPFAGADPTFVRGEEVDVPSVSGLGVEAAKTALADVGLVGYVASGRVDDPSTAAGRVSSTRPGPGATVPLGTRVALLVSTGNAPPPPPPSPSSPEPTPSIVVTVPPPATAPPKPKPKPKPTPSASASAAAPKGRPSTPGPAG